MTYRHIVIAKKAVDELNTSRFPLQISYKLYKLKKKIDEIFQFEVDSEKKSISLYNGTIQQDGTITFQNKSDCEACTEAITNILNTALDEDIEPVRIPMNVATDIKVSPEMIDHLDGFVQFVDGSGV